MGCAFHTVCTVDVKPAVSGLDLLQLSTITTVQHPKTTYHAEKSGLKLCSDRTVGDVVQRFVLQTHVQRADPAAAVSLFTRVVKIKMVA